VEGESSRRGVFLTTNPPPRTRARREAGHSNPRTIAMTQPDPTSSDRIPLSPLHSIVIAEGLRQLLDTPQEKDFPVHTIARKTGPDGRDLVLSQLVIAGKQTRSAFPRAREYPVHFVKQYHPWSLHGDPAVEFENSSLAAEILGIPAPIGYDRNSIRSAFIPGKPLSRLSPFTDVEPQERCLEIALKADPAMLIGLWKLAEEIYRQLETLHARGFFHRDMELHNIIICTSPLQPFLIDFESAERDFNGSEEEREERRFRDLEELFRLAVYVQSGLGRQEGALAAASLEALPKLFRSSDTFASRLDAADRRASGG